MTRLSKKTIEDEVTGINAMLANRNIETRVKMVQQYGKISIYKTDQEGKWIKHLFIGNTREVYNYLWGMFDALY